MRFRPLTATHRARASVRDVQVRMARLARPRVWHIAGPREHNLPSGMLTRPRWALGLRGLCLTLLLLWTPIAWAAEGDTVVSEVASQDADPEVIEAARGAVIVRIDVDGNRRISKEDVVSYLRERLGQKFAPAALSQDVRELWGSGFFDDIRVDLEIRDQGVTLRFIVRERPNVKAVKFVGNDEVDDDDLEEAIELKADSILSRPAIARSIQKIRDMYAEKGYFLAEAESAIKTEKSNEVTVEFKITEHSQVSVRRISFIGNNHVPDDELRAVMFTGQSSILNFGSGGPFRQDAFERDIAVINALYYDQGYLAAQIFTPRVMLTPDRTGIELSITVDEGPRFKLRQFRILERGPDGKEIEPIGGRKSLRNLVKAQPGDYFNRAALLDDLNQVRTLYRDEGYANVDANPDVKLDPETNEVDVVVPIRRGPVVYFDRIEIRGNTKTRDKVIRREMEVVEGQRFSETLLERSRRRVTALGFFERVDVATSPGSSADRIDIQVEVIEKPTGTFQVGAGFSSIENLIATAQVQEANWMGNGQNASLNAQISGLRSQVNFSLYEPYFLDTNFRFSTSLYSQQQYLISYVQDTLGGSLTWGYPLIQPELSLSLTYTLERINVSTDTSRALIGSTLPSVQTGFVYLPLRSLYNDGVTSSFRPTITLDTRDNRLFPTSGIYIRGSTELSLSEIGATTEFWRNTLTSRFYYPLGAGIVLKLNTEFGLITSPNPDGVPIFARYFLGGVYDVRGFRYRSLSPRISLTDRVDPNSASSPGGAAFGGNMMFYDNLEFEFPIMQEANIRGVFFTDAGNTWNLESRYCQALQGAIKVDVQKPCFDFPGGFTNIRTSWGYGIRWFSPMGPLRFEFGYPFTRLPGEDFYRFEFAIGNFF